MMSRFDICICMSKSSENVKRWRYNCKERIIEAMGGGCCVCGYNKCQRSLALHHLDPSKKDLSFGAVRANPKNWTALVAELRKCILVCHNCHCEIHDGIINVPNDAPTFNEMFADYKEIERAAKLNPCPVCGKLKSMHLINCSTECAHRSNFKVQWDIIDLKEMIKTKSVVTIAEELGCSDSAVHKRLKKLKLK